MNPATLIIIAFLLACVVTGFVIAFWPDDKPVYDDRDCDGYGYYDEDDDEL